MTDFEIDIKISKDDEVKGATVTIESDSQIQTITVTEKEKLEKLTTDIQKLLDEALMTSDENIKAYLEDLNLSANSLKEGDFERTADYFAKTDHTHNEYAPMNHASSKNIYGEASSTDYGHVKVVNSVDSNKTYSNSTVVGATFISKLLTQINKVSFNVRQDRYKIILYRRTRKNGNDTYQYLNASHIWFNDDTTQRLGFMVINKITGQRATELEGKIVEISYRGSPHFKQIQIDKWGRGENVIKWTLKGWTLINANLPGGRDKQNHLYSHTSSFKYVGRQK